MTSPASARPRPPTRSVSGLPESLKQDYVQPRVGPLRASSMARASATRSIRGLRALHLAERDQRQQGGEQRHGPSPRRPKPPRFFSYESLRPFSRRWRSAGGGRDGRHPSGQPPRAAGCRCGSTAPGARSSPPRLRPADSPRRPPSPANAPPGSPSGWPRLPDARARASGAHLAGVRRACGA